MFSSCDGGSPRAEVPPQSWKGWTYGLEVLPFDRLGRVPWGHRQ